MENHYWCPGYGVLVGIIISMTKLQILILSLFLPGYAENLEAAEESLKTLIDVNEPQVQHIPISDKLILPSSRFSSKNCGNNGR